MKYLIVVLILIMVSSAFGNEWFTDDKIVHGVFSFGLGFVSSMIFKSEVAGFTISFGIGTGKEFSDYKRDGTFNYRDEVWNFGGTTLGCLTYYLMKDKRFERTNYLNKKYNRIDFRKECGNSN